MAESTTILVQRCLKRLEGGEAQAQDELLRCAAGRLELLTRKMLRGYNRVRRWEETADVFQNAALRLCRALAQVRPATPLDFFRLAALQVRRELVDLARHHYGPEGQGAHHASQVKANSEVMPIEPADAREPNDDLAAWTQFHEQAGALPDEEREVFDLLWYQGLEQAEAAELLGTSTRTIKRRWQSARLMLHTALNGNVPQIG